MNANLTPAFLSSLVPDNVGNLVNYNLRNAGNARIVHCNSQLYANSFLPSTIREWNELPPSARNSESISVFKSRLDSNRTTVPQYYFTGNRKAHILHTRLSTHCSSLNQHLFSKNIVESPLCVCRSLEDTNHFHCTVPENSNE